MSSDYDPNEKLVEGNRAKQRQAIRLLLKKSKPPVRRVVQNQEQDAMAIICDNVDCRKSYNLKRHYDKQPAPEKGEDGASWGLRCPHCGSFVHCYYVNKESNELRAKLQTAQLLYQRRKTPANWNALLVAKEQYQAKHVELNPNGVQAPGA